MESTSCLPPYPSRKNLQIPQKIVPTNWAQKTSWNSPFPFPPGLVGRQSQISSQKALNQWLPQPSCLRPPRQQRRSEEGEIPGTHTIHVYMVYLPTWCLIFVVNVSKLPVPRILWGSHMLRMYGIITKPFPLVKMWPFLHLSCGRKYSHPIRAHLGLFLWTPQGRCGGKRNGSANILEDEIPFGVSGSMLVLGYCNSMEKNTDCTANLGVLLIFLPSATKMSFLDENLIVSCGWIEILIVASCLTQQPTLLVTGHGL